MVFDILVVLYRKKRKTSVGVRVCGRNRLTQVEVVVDGVTSDEDQTQEVEEGGDGGIVTIDVASLVTTPGTGGLGNNGGTLGQVLIHCIMLSHEASQTRVLFIYLVERDELGHLTILSSAATHLGGSSNVRRNESLGAVGTTEDVGHGVHDG